MGTNSKILMENKEKTSRRKHEIKRLGLMLIVSLTLILMISSVSAFEFDNVKNYYPETKTIEVRNSVLGIPFLSLDKVAEVKLNSELNQKVRLGYGKVFEYEMTLYDDYTNPLKVLNLYNIKNDLQPINRNVDYKYLTYEEVSINDTEYICNKITLKNGTINNECNVEVIGTHQEQKEKWLPLEKFIFVKGENITIGGFTYVENGDKIEWIPEYFGVKINEWASWEASMEVGLISAYSFDGDLIDAYTGAYNLSVKLGAEQYNTTLFKNGQALDLNGDDSMENTAMPEPTAWAWSFWLYPRVVDQNHYVLSQQSDAVNTFFLQFNTYARTVMGGYTTNCDILATANEWEHVVIQADSSTNLSIYKNGVFCATGAYNGAGRNGNLKIGGRSGVTPNVLFDDFLFYERTLNGDEISVLAEGTYFGVGGVDIQVNLTIDKASPQTYGTEINISCDTDSNSTTKQLFINSINYTTSLSQNIILGGGTNLINCTINETDYFNYGENSTTYTINTAIPTGTITGSTLIAYGSQANVEGIETNTNDADVIYTLVRNGTAVSNPDMTVLDIGIWNYTFNSTGGQNYTTNNTLDSFILEVVSAPAVSSILLNPSDNYLTNNPTIDLSTNITAVGGATLGNYTTFVWVNSTGVFEDSSESIVNCHQEFANVTNYCGGLNTGEYSETGTFINPSYWYDGNPATKTIYDGSGDDSLFVNYTIPSGFTNYSMFFVTYGDSLNTFEHNEKIDDSCWNYGQSLDSPTIYFKFNFSTISNTCNAYCYNGTWKNIFIKNCPNTNKFVSNEDITWKETNETNKVINETFTLTDNLYKWNTLTCATDNSVNCSWGTSNRTFTIDTIVPILTIEKPSIENDWANSINTTIVNSNEDITTCYYNLNGAGNLSMTSTNTTSFSQSITATEGNNSMFISCNDTANNWGESSVVNWTYTKYPPSITLTSPTGTINYHKSGNNLTLNWTSEDEDGVSSCWYVYGGVNKTVPCSTNTTEFVVNNSNYKTVNFYSNDTLGNIANKTISWDYRVFEINNAYQSSIMEGLKDKISYYFYTDYSLEEGNLIYDSVQETGTYSQTGNYWNLTKDKTIPSVTTDTNKTFYWNLVFDDLIEVNTTTKTQLIKNFNVGNCTAYPDVILNFSLKDEETNNYVNNVSSKIELDLNLYPLDRSYQVLGYSNTWYNETNVSVCGNLTGINYSLDVVVGFNMDDRVNEFYYLDNASLSTSNILNSLTNKTINLMNLLTADSTSFLFNYLDLDGLVVDNIIIHTFRKYIGDGLFREVERSKQNEGGDTVVHLVEEDVIYYFIVSKNSQILYTSTSYTALCQATPCEIQLEASGGFEQFSEEWDLIDNGLYTLTSNSLTREVNLTYVLTSPSTMNLTVYKLASDGSYDVVGSGKSTSSQDSILVTVPVVSGNTTFFASIYQDSVFKKSAWIDFEDDAGLYFGNTLSLFLGALIILTLGLIAVAEGSGVIIFLILGMFISMALGLVDYRTSTGLNLFIYFVIAGAIIIWKVTRRNR